MKRKLLKLSLISILVVGSSSFASGNTLSEALTNGKYDGELKAYFYDRDRGAIMNKGSAADTSILTFGVRLNYVSDYFYNFRLALSTQTSNSPYADSESKKAFNWDVYGTGGVLSQAYLEYAVDKTSVKFGRQYVKMPLLFSSNSRIIKQAYEGLTFITEDIIPDTAISGGYITNFQNRTDGDGNVAEFEDLVGDYAYTVAFKNTTIPNTAITMAYGETDESYKMDYFEVAYKNSIDELRYKASAQYSDTNYDKSTTKDAYFYGLKMDLGIGDLNTYLAYAEVNDGTTKWSITGGGKPLIYTTTIINAGEYTESEQYAVDVNYKFKDLGGLLLGARYLDVDYENNTAANFTTLYGKYKFKGALKGLSTSVYYEEKEADTEANEFNELWVYLTYKF